MPKGRRQKGGHYNNNNNNNNNKYHKQQNQPWRGRSGKKGKKKFQNHSFDQQRYNSVRPPVVNEAERMRQQALSVQKKKVLDVLRVEQKKVLEKSLEQRRSLVAVKKKTENWPHDGFGDGSCEALLKASKRYRRQRFDSHDSQFNSSVFKAVNRYRPPKQQQTSASSSVVSGTIRPKKNTEKLVIKNSFREVVYGPAPPPNLAASHASLLLPENDVHRQTGVVSSCSSSCPSTTAAASATISAATPPTTTTANTTLSTTSTPSSSTLVSTRIALNKKLLAPKRNDIKTSFASSSSSSESEADDLTQDTRNESLKNDKHEISTPQKLFGSRKKDTAKKAVKDRLLCFNDGDSDDQCKSPKKKPRVFENIVASLDAQYGKSAAPATSSVSSLSEQAVSKKFPAALKKQTCEQTQNVHGSTKVGSSSSDGGKSRSGSASSSNSSSSSSSSSSSDSDSDSDSDSSGRDNKSEQDDEQSEPAVEGFLQNDVLYLRDVTTNTIYSGTRDEEEALVKIGHWDPSSSTIVASRRSEHVVGVAAPIYPFLVDADDHCETPQIAYEHISPVLQTLARSVRQSSNRNLKIWDPFFCAGNVANHLNALGFDDVYNENEDFYLYDGGKTSGPLHYDVLVTNPPYTAEHIPKLLKFCKASGKPCFLLLPNYVLHKYAKQLGPLQVSSSSALFFVWSKSRYKYKSPKFARSKDKARKDRVTSPFVSFWYCYIPSSATATAAVQVEKLQRDYTANLKRVKGLVPVALKDNEVGTSEQEKARRLLKGRFEVSSQRLPDFLLDHAHGHSNNNKSTSKRRHGGKLHEKKRGKKHRKI